MSRIAAIADLDDSSAGWGFFLCARKDVRTGRDGGDFVTLVLQDASGRIPAKIVDDVDALRDAFEAGEFVKVQAHAGRHHQKLELVIEKIRRVEPTQDRLDGFLEEACILSAPRPVEEMWTELQSRIAAVGNPWLRQLLSAIVARHAERLRVWPAAMMVHHAYRGGLLEHILTLAETGRLLADVYDVDRDLVVTGAVLHDLGKLEELRYDGVASYTQSGNLLGHITIGVIMVREAIQAIDGFPDGLRLRVEHLILSHHGAREFGSPVEPMTKEAFILSAIDDLDATLHQFSRHVAEDDGEGDFTGYHPRLKRVLLKPSVR